MVQMNFVNILLLSLGGKENVKILKSNLKFWIKFCKIAMQGPRKVAVDSKTSTNTIHPKIARSANKQCYPQPTFFLCAILGTRSTAFTTQCKLLFSAWRNQICMTMSRSGNSINSWQSDPTQPPEEIIELTKDGLWSFIYWYKKNIK